MRYQLVLETTPTSVGAYVPDLPGCVAVGADRDEALRPIREGIEFHLEGLRGAGVQIQARATRLELVEVEAA
jgi:predicted RNase H-like HicB family nuclease